MNINGLDPLSDRVYRYAAELLKTKNEITINDLLDVTEFSDFVLRTRLDLLVKANKLGFAKGIGRRPSYYFMPSFDTCYASETIEATLKQQQTTLLSTLASFKAIRQSQDEIIAAIESLISRNVIALEDARKLLNNQSTEDSNR